ncbi:kinase-like domain-containing protein [Pilobolus umbonatus]|nr:kinase-like domain-containing protein [Pilobolus umbonatus]
MVEKEIEFMRRLGDHKNIVRYYASRIDAIPSGGFEALILMEYCPGGGVIDLMNRRLQQRLTEPEILKIFSDVAEALAYMHYCNPPVLHRDLKVENILILNQDHYKLCDFGSASLSKGNYIPHNLREVQKLEDDIQRHTTLQYRAPEMIDIYQKKPINEKADIWAMGVLLYKLCYYTTPFEEEGQLAILNARYTIPNTPMFSDGLRHLIMSMLQEDQNRRPTIYQVMKAVCNLRGLDCPIRDIYADAVSSPPPTMSHKSPEPENVSIFENISMPVPEAPVITPMRRGRPTKNDKPLNADHQGSPDPHGNFKSNHQHSNSGSSTGSNKYDPFDPAYVRNGHATTSTETTDNNLNSFQNSFTMDTNDSHPSRVQSAPASRHTTPIAQTAVRIQTQPNSPKTASPVVIPTKSVSGKLHNKNLISVEDDNEPKMNKRVSSSIEARFMAIKNASRSNSPGDSILNKTPTPVKPSPTVSQTLKKNKPIPPPKPARFRSNPTAVPNLDEFENKFPSLEDLDRQLPVE